MPRKIIGIDEIDALLQHDSMVTNRFMTCTELPSFYRFFFYGSLHEKLYLDSGKTISVRQFVNQYISNVGDDEGTRNNAYIRVVERYKTANTLVPTYEKMKSDADNKGDFFTDVYHIKKKDVNLISKINEILDYNFVRDPLARNYVKRKSDDVVSAVDIKAGYNHLLRGELYKVDFPVFQSIVQIYYNMIDATFPKNSLDNHLQRYMVEAQLGFEAIKYIVQKATIFKQKCVLDKIKLSKGFSEETASVLFRIIRYPDIRFARRCTDVFFEDYTKMVLTKTMTQNEFCKKWVIEYLDNRKPMMIITGRLENIILGEDDVFQMDLSNKDRIFSLISKYCTEYYFDAIYTECDNFNQIYYRKLMNMYRPQKNNQLAPR